MSKFGQTRHTWQLRTTVDPRRPFDAQLLHALEEIQRKERINESRAVMRLLWLGWHAYHNPSPVQGASRESELVSGPRPQRSSRRRTASKPVPPRARSAASVEMAPQGVAVEQPLVSHTRPRTQEPPQSSPTLAPATQAITNDLPNPGGGLMKFRTMVLSRSVAPPEAVAPRVPTNAIEAHTLVPAVLASTLAKLNSDGREV